MRYNRILVREALVIAPKVCAYEIWVYHAKASIDQYYCHRACDGCAILINAGRWIVAKITYTVAN